MSSKPNKKIDALFQDNVTNIKVDLDDEYQPQEVDITLIDRNPNQPRKYFDPKSIEELSQSIKAYGVLQPIIVVKNGLDRYMIIAGERRFRASIEAKLKKVPVIVRDYTPQQIAEISLIENLNREDLNAIESAEGIREIIDNYGLTQQEVANRIGKSREYVSNTLRLLQLPQEVIELVKEGKLSPGHARALISIDDKDYLIALAKQACENGLSVRDLENRARLYFTRKEIPATKKENKTPTVEMKNMVNEMKRLLGTRVKLVGNEEKGRITIDYFTKDDLERVNAWVQLLKFNKDMK